MGTIESLEDLFDPKNEPKRYAEHLIREYEKLRGRHKRIPSGEYDDWYEKAKACLERGECGDAIKLAFCASRYLTAKIKLEKKWD